MAMITMIAIVSMVALILGYIKGALTNRIVIVIKAIMVVRRHQSNQSNQGNQGNQG
jgi:hypothetical protein